MQSAGAAPLNPIYAEPLDRAKFESDATWWKRAQVISVIAVVLLATPPLVYASMFAAWWIAPAGSALTVQLMLKVHHYWQQKIQGAEAGIEIAKKYEAIQEPLMDLEETANRERIVTAHIQYAKERLEALKTEYNMQRLQAEPASMEELLKRRNNLYLIKQAICKQFLYLSYLTLVKNTPELTDPFETLLPLNPLNSAEEHAALKEHLPEHNYFVTLKNGKKLSLNKVFSLAYLEQIEDILNGCKAKAPTLRRSQSFSHLPVKRLATAAQPRRAATV